MTATPNIEQRLSQLATEIGTQPGLVEHVLRHARDPVAAPRGTLAFGNRHYGRWGLVSGVAAVLLIGVGVWLAATPRSLHARMLAALAKVQSVHITGWSNRVVRRWPLEQPVAGVLDTGRVEVEAWFWTDEFGVPRSYEKQGPVTVIRRASEIREYQEDVDLLFILENAFVKDRVGEFAGLAQYFQALDRPGLTKKELGVRKGNDGATLAGIELVEHNRTREVWWDANSFLPVKMIESDRGGESRVESELTFRCNEPVPATVAGYTPPQAKQVRYGGSDKVNQAWREHVEALGRQIQTSPPQGRMTLIVREGGRIFGNEFTLATPDGQFWVVPLGGLPNFPATIEHVFRFHVGSPHSTTHSVETWRIPTELQELTYQHDLVYRSGVTWQEWVQFMLAHFDLEFVDVIEERTYWVAHHDGRTRKPWLQVKPPVPYIVEGGVEKKGLVKPGVGMKLVPVTLEELFDDFNTLQSRGLTAKSIIIEDQTGLPRPPKFDPSIHGDRKSYDKNVLEPQFYAASDSPWFAGALSIEMAREWYRSELGITFAEESRPVTVHVVRRKQN